MSVTYTAVTLVGCCVTRDKIYKMERVRVCGDPHVGDGRGCKLDNSGIDYSEFKACPFCTSSMWQNVETKITEYGENSITILYPKYTKIDVVNRSSLWFVGHIIGSVHNENKHVVTADLNLEEKRDILEPILKQLDLWNDSYGVYTILLVS